MTYLPHSSGGTSALKQSVRDARRALKAAPGVRFLICTGISGLSVAAPLAYLTGKQLVVVRKSEPSHGAPIEAPADFWRTRSSTNCCIIDDFIDSGRTLRLIQTSLSMVPHWLLLYAERHDEWEPDLWHGRPEDHSYHWHSPFLFRHELAKCPSP